jgi:plastocyanin|tara:strand:+ start:156 stop:497 length:342 start_codon:yes stop_codon:yes gene_type:complete
MAAKQEAEVASGAAADLVKLINAAGPEAQHAMRQALGVGGAIKKAKQTQTNADAKRVSYSVGEVVHPEGFQPKPSEAKVQQGKDVEWLATWNERNNNPTSGSKAEEYAAVAHM